MARSFTKICDELARNGGVDGASHTLLDEGNANSFSEVVSGYLISLEEHTSTSVGNQTMDWIARTGTFLLVELRLRIHKARLRKSRRG